MVKNQKSSSQIDFSAGILLWNTLFKQNLVPWRSDITDLKCKTEAEEKGYCYRNNTKKHNN